jgi:excisionase family DNA binding protein
MVDGTVNTADRLWTVRDVAAYLGVPMSTLYAWRTEGKGPAGRRVGRYVRYRPEDVRAWVAALPVGVAA